MPRYTIKVPDDDEGHYLGDYDADYLPRVGDPIAIDHPQLNPRPHHPCLGVVSAITHEARSPAPDNEDRRGTVGTTVWVVEDSPAPQLFCDCTDAERAKYGADRDGDCMNCSHLRRTVSATASGK